MVLVGHSLGGLISKLQITSSGDRLWRSIASRPFDEVSMKPGTQVKLAESFFFEPSPDVKRVVFIGTPHGGSGIANRSLGRLGSALVNEPLDRVQGHAELIRCNPGVFRREVGRRIPTSIDFLNPKSHLLEAVSTLPVHCNVKLHSIIGNSCWNPLSGTSDGVVPLTSAKKQRSTTERLVKAPHAKLHKHRDSIHELLMILQLHLDETSCSVKNVELVTEEATPLQWLDTTDVLPNPRQVQTES